MSSTFHPGSTMPLSAATDAPEIVCLFRGGRKELMEEIARGAAPDEFLYGLPQVQELRRPMAVIESVARPPWFHPFFRLVENGTARFGLGLFFTTPLLHWRTLRQARVVVATTDSTALPVLFFKQLGWIRGRIIVVSQGLHSAGENVPAWRWRLIQRFARKMIGAADAVIALGDGDADAIRESLRPARIELIQFGIDAGFWTPSREDAANGPVLSVGSDGMRDYPVLLEAIGDRPLQLVTRLALPERLLRPNVRVESRLTWHELRECYRRARYVVTPVLDQRRDSGHSATLQAMACGKAVILSRTAGLWDRERMKHLETCYLVEPENVAALREAMDYFEQNPGEAERIGRNACELVRRSYTSRHFGEALAQLVMEIDRA